MSNQSFSKEADDAPPVLFCRLAMRLTVASLLDAPQCLWLSTGREDRILVGARHDRVIRAVDEQHRARADRPDRRQRPGVPQR